MNLSPFCVHHASSVQARRYLQHPDPFLACHASSLRAQEAQAENAQKAFKTPRLPHRDPAPRLGICPQGGSGRLVARQQASRQYRSACSSQGARCQLSSRQFRTPRCPAAPLVLVLRTLLSRPDLAQAVQHLRFDGYDFVERRVHQLPTTPIFHLSDDDKLKAVQFIRALDLYQGLDWAKAFQKGQVDSLVSLLVALTPKVRSIYLGEFFSVEIYYLRMLLSPESFGTPGGSNVHKFEHLRHVTVDNHCATYHHTLFDFNNVYQDFFRLRMLESLAISGSFPENSQPFTISTKLEHLRCLDLTRIGETELGRILSIAPNLKELKYIYAFYPLKDIDSTHEQTLDMKTLCSSLEGHRQTLEKLELLALDDGDVLAEESDITCWPLNLQGSFLKLHDFSSLCTLTAPWIFIAGPSKGEHPSPLLHLIPRSVVQLALTDDLCLQLYWDWDPLEVWEMITDYWHDLKDTKTALATMFLVGPLFAPLFMEDELHNARQLAGSVGVDFWPVEQTIHNYNELQDAEERARRYG